RLRARGIKAAVDDAVAARTLLQGGQAPRVKGVDDIPDGLPAEADAGRDRADVLAPGAGQDDLRPPEDKGVGRAQAVLQGLALRVRRWTDEQWCFSHTRSMPLIKLSCLRHHYERARALCEESLAVHREEIADSQGIAVVLLSLGPLAHEQGDVGRAERLFAESMVLAQR